MTKATRAAVFNFCLLIFASCLLPCPSGLRRGRGRGLRALGAWAAVGARGRAGLGLAAVAGRAVDRGVVGLDGFDVLQLRVDERVHANHFARGLLGLLVVLLPLVGAVAGW